GVTVDLREGDLTALDPGLTGFDLIFIGGGGICWVPDLEAWARTVADRLIPGGRIVISEHHPVWEVLSVAGANRLTVSADYFTPSRPGYADPDKAPQVTRGRTEPLPDHVSFVWSLGAVVSALLEARLRLGLLREFAEPELYRGLGPEASACPPRTSWPRSAPSIPDTGAGGIVSRARSGPIAPGPAARPPAPGRPPGATRRGR